MNGQLSRSINNISNDTTVIVEMYQIAVNCIILVSIHAGLLTKMEPGAEQ